MKKKVDFLELITHVLDIEGDIKVKLSEDDLPQGWHLCGKSECFYVTNRLLKLEFHATVHAEPGDKPENSIDESDFLNQSDPISCDSETTSDQHEETHARVCRFSGTEKKVSFHKTIFIPV